LIYLDVGFYVTLWSVFSSYLHIILNLYSTKIQNSALESHFLLIGKTFFISIILLVRAYWGFRTIPRNSNFKSLFPLKGKKKNKISKFHIDFRKQHQGWLFQVHQKSVAKDVLGL
jgi:hypothetical protein